jgi:maltose O-acetyltransferase
MKIIIKNIAKKILRFIQRIRYSQNIRIFYYALLSSRIRIRGKLIRWQPLLIVGKGSIVVNGVARVGNFPSPFYFNGYAHFDLRGNNAYIELGNGVIFNNNPTLVADGAAITIGDDTLIGLNFTVMTSDAHGL